MADAPQREQTVVVACRVALATKERLNAIAAFQGKTISALLNTLIDRRLETVTGLCIHEFVNAEGRCGRCGEVGS